MCVAVGFVFQTRKITTIDKRVVDIQTVNLTEAAQKPLSCAQFSLLQRTGVERFNLTKIGQTTSGPIEMYLRSYITKEPFTVAT